MSSLKYWVWLASAKGISAYRASEMLARFGGAEQVFCADKDELSALEGLHKNELTALYDKNLAAAEDILINSRQRGIRIITQQDAEYPAKLKNITDPPVVLYCKGSLPSVDETLSIAIVGPRKPSVYALVSADRFAHRLSEAGAVIVSGMAQGVDAEAGRGALKANRPTVAVLGCGLDICYPASSRDIYESIPFKGAIISEYPPGTPPVAVNFPARNRIISGLSDGVLVPEAGAKSGALITAACALEQGRDVFCIPGNIGVDSSEGTNQLLVRGEAKAVTRPWEILEEYTGLYPSLSVNEKEMRFDTYYDQVHPEYGRDHKIETAAQTKSHGYSANGHAASATGIKTRNDDLEADEQTLVGCLKEGRKHIDDLIRETGMPAQKVLTMLTLLEMKGIITQLTGKYFTLKL